MSHLSRLLYPSTPHPGALLGDGTTKLGSPRLAPSLLPCPLTWPRNVLQICLQCCFRHLLSLSLLPCGSLILDLTVEESCENWYICDIQPVCALMQLHLPDCQYQLLSPTALAAISEDIWCPRPAYPAGCSDLLMLKEVTNGKGNQLSQDSTQTRSTSLLSLLFSRRFHREVTHIWLCTGHSIFFTAPTWKPYLLAHYYVLLAQFLLWNAFLFGRNSRQCALIRAPHCICWSVTSVNIWLIPARQGQII